MAGQQETATRRATIHAEVDDSVTKRLDVLVSDIQAKTQGRKVTKAEVIRDCFLLGLGERERKRAR